MYRQLRSRTLSSNRAPDVRLEIVVCAGARAGALL